MEIKLVNNVLMDILC